MVCAPFLPPCSCHSEAGGSQPPALTHQPHPSKPPAAEPGSAMLSTGLHPFNSSPAQLGTDERTQLDVDSGGVFFQKNQDQSVAQCADRKACLGRLFPPISAPALAS